MPFNVYCIEPMSESTNQMNGRRQFGIGHNFPRLSFITFYLAALARVGWCAVCMPLIHQDFNANELMEKQNKKQNNGFIAN